MSATPASLRTHAQWLRRHAAELVAEIAECQRKASELEQQASALEQTSDAEPFKVICPVPCGKRRFRSEDAARSSQRFNSHRLRFYYAAECGCWHAAKRESR